MMNNEKYTSEENLKNAFENFEIPFEQEAFAKFENSLDNVTVTDGGINWIKIVKSKIFFASTIVTIVAATIFVSLSISDEVNSPKTMISETSSETNGTTKDKPTIIKERASTEKKASSLEVQQNSESANNHTVNTVKQQGVEKKLLSSTDTNTGSTTRKTDSDIQSPAQQETNLNSIVNENTILENENLFSSPDNSVAQNDLVQTTESEFKKSYPQDNVTETTRPIIDKNVSSLSVEKSLEENVAASSNALVMSLDELTALEISYLSAENSELQESLLSKMKTVHPLIKPIKVKKINPFYLKFGVLMAKDKHDFGVNPYLVPHKSYQLGWRIALGYEINNFLAAEFGLLIKEYNQKWKLNPDFNSVDPGTEYSLFNSTSLSTRLIGNLDVVKNRVGLTPKLGYTLGNPDLMLGYINNFSADYTNLPDMEQELYIESETFGLKENAYHLFELGMGVEISITKNLSLDLDYAHFIGTSEILQEVFEYRIDGGVVNEVKVTTKGSFSSLDMSIKYNF